MARIWMTGLEAGHMDVFDSHSAAVSVAQARTGVYSLNISTTLVYASAVFPASISEVFGRFGMRATFTFVGPSLLLMLRDSNGDPQISINLNPAAHTIECRRGAYNGVLLAQGGEIHQNRWHCIEFHLIVADAGGVFQLKIDGTQVINYSDDTQDTANANVASFRFGGTYGELSYYDDIAFNDASGGVNHTWIGRGGIQGIFPEGVGNSTDLGLFPNTGEVNWEDVDEVPPDDDTMYVFDDVINEHDSYETEDLPATGDTIAAVQWLARAKSDLAGAPEIARILHFAGGDQQGADIAIDTDYDYYPEILDEDPDAAGPWTVAAVNGMEIGVKVR